MRCVFVHINRWRNNYANCQVTELNDDCIIIMVFVPSSLQLYVLIAFDDEWFAVEILLEQFKHFSNGEEENGGGC